MFRFDEILISEFRGLVDLELPGLSRINILVGDNNCGKTSVLEAIRLLVEPLDSFNYHKVGAMRYRMSNLPSGSLYSESIRWLFPQTNLKEERKTIQISGWNLGKEKRLRATYEDKIFLIPDHPDFSPLDDSNIDSDEVKRLKLEKSESEGLELKVEYKEEGTSPTNKKFRIIDNKLMVFSANKKKASIPVRLITPLENRFGANLEEISTMLLPANKAITIEALAMFDHYIYDIELLAPKGRPQLVVHHKLMGPTPLYVFGDGLRKALSFAVALSNCRDGILLIDELETGIHTSALGNLFSWISNVSEKYNIQIIATTHSLEAVDAIILANKTFLESMVAYRLESGPKRTIARRFDGKNLYDIRYTFGQDVR
jgi:AAA15 family ATPase/GTPase